MCIYIHIYTHTNTHTHMYLYTYVHKKHKPNSYVALLGTGVAAQLALALQAHGQQLGALILESPFYSLGAAALTFGAVLPLRVIPGGIWLLRRFCVGGLRTVPQSGVSPIYPHWYIYMYIYMYIHTHTYIYIFMNVSISITIYIRLYINIYVCICIYICTRSAPPPSLSEPCCRYAPSPAVFGCCGVSVRAVSVRK